MMKTAIITNAAKDKDLAAARRAADAFAGRAEIFMPDTAVVPGHDDINYVPQDEIWGKIDTALIIGGDGTMLRAAPHCAAHGIPTLGINLGRVGFLTEVEPEDIPYAAERILNGDYTTERRMLLKFRINGGSGWYHALNDIVAAKTDGERLIAVELYTDGELVNCYDADGLIIATPTGSTGYSISAGGPVVDPRMSLCVATPICAHMLSVRSAVLPVDKDIVIKLRAEHPRNDAIITADGERMAVISEKDELQITRSELEFSLIRIGRSSFYDTLIHKL